MQIKPPPTPPFLNPRCVSPVSVTFGRRLWRWAEPASAASCNNRWSTNPIIDTRDSIKGRVINNSKPPLISRMLAK